MTSNREVTGWPRLRRGWFWQLAIVLLVLLLEQCPLPPQRLAKTTADYTAAVALAVRPPWELPTVSVLDVYRK
jgi:hypothetical protein